MEHQTKINKIDAYVSDIFAEDASGHDYSHMKRVAKMAKRIAEAEQANPYISEIAGWLHDVGDQKLFVNPDEAKKSRTMFLEKIGITKNEVKQIISAIQDVSFSKGSTPETLEGKIVQDADRLDAIGAIGIARTFAYGGYRGQKIYKESNEEGGSTSIDHFYDKLLLLKRLMNTESAGVIAEQRHVFLERYLEQFHKEWER